MAEVIVQESEEHRHDSERSPLLRSASQNTNASSFLGIPVPSLSLERKYYWVLVPFLLGTLADFGDGAMFRRAYVQIGIDLNDEYLQAWLFLVYTITMAIGRPLYALAKDELGWSRPLALSYILFSLGLFGCYLSPSIGWLLAARLLTASGSAGMVYVPNLFVNDAIPPNLVPNWTSLFGLMGLFARLAGSFLAGARHLDYLRTLFLGELILPTLSFGFIAWKTNFFRDCDDYAGPSLAPTASHDNDYSRRDLWVSVSSTFYLVLSMGFLCAALSLVADQLDFELEIELAMLVLSAVFLFRFVAYQKKLSSTNSTAIMFPTGLNNFEYTNLIAVFAGGFLLNGAYAAFAFILPPLGNAAAFSPTWGLWAYWGGEFIGYLCVASYTQRYNKVRPIIIVGTVLCSVSSAVMFIWWEGVQYVFLSLACIAAYGVGFGTIEPGFRSQLLKNLRGRENYKTKMYNLFQLVILSADLIFTATSNVLIQSAKSGVTPTETADRLYQDTSREYLRDVSWFVTASTALGDIPLASLSSSIGLIMISSFLVTAIVLCFVEDSESEDR